MRLVDSMCALLCVLFLTSQNCAAAESLSAVESLSAPNPVPQTLKRADVPVDTVEQYLSILQKRVKRFWCPPKNHQNAIVVVAFSIQSDGKIADLKLTHSSGQSLADKAALSAVEHAAPFAPYAQISELRGDMLVEVTFRYPSRDGVRAKILNSTDVPEAH